MWRKKNKILDPTHTESFQKPTPETAFDPKTVLKYYKTAVQQPDVNPIKTIRGIWSLISGNDAIPIFCFLKFVHGEISFLKTFFRRHTTRKLSNKKKTTKPVLISLQVLTAIQYGPKEK